MTVIDKNVGITASHYLTGSRLDRVEVAHGVAVVLPLILEDYVQAREGGLMSKPSALAPASV
jgi:hypothetical protein